MFFLNPKKVKAENPTPRWFTALMVLFFAFVVYRAMYPVDAPENEVTGGERLLEEMPSLKRVVSGETFKAATNIMEEEAIEETVAEALEGEAPQEIETPQIAEDALTLEASPTSNDDKNLARFTISARNGRGEVVDIVFEGKDGELVIGPNQARTLILPPENGEEMRVITIKRID